MRSPLFLRSRHPLIKAEVSVHFDVGESLNSRGEVQFKIPFKDKMSFEFSGSDIFGAMLALSEFKISDGKKYFARWWSEADKIFYRDQRREANFAAADVQLMSPAAILFCVLAERSSEFSALYVGADKLYQLDFIRSADAKSIQVYQLNYPNTSMVEVKKLAAGGE